MKGVLALIILMAILLSSCGKDEPSQSTLDSLQQEWQYVLFFGAEAPQCDYNRGDKIYTFGISTLFVDDNYLDDDLCGGTFKGEGTYDYEVKVINDTEYLFIEGEEQGRIRFVNGDLLIESWFYSSGVEIADAPTYRMEL